MRLRLLSCEVIDFCWNFRQVRRRTTDGRRTGGRKRLQHRRRLPNSMSEKNSRVMHARARPLLLLLLLLRLLLRLRLRNVAHLLHKTKSGSFARRCWAHTGSACSLDCKIGAALAAAVKALSGRTIWGVGRDETTRDICSTDPRRPIIALASVRRRLNVALMVMKRPIRLDVVRIANVSHNHLLCLNMAAQKLQQTASLPGPGTSFEREHRRRQMHEDD